MTFKFWNFWKKKKEVKAPVASKNDESSRKNSGVSDEAVRLTAQPAHVSFDTAFTIAEPMPGVIPPGVKPLAQDTAISSAYNWATSGAFQEGMGFLGYPYLAELSQRPEYRRISETLAKEMTRKWIRLVSVGDGDGKAKADKLQAIEAEMKRLKVQAAFRKAAELDGFFGRAHIFLDVCDITDTTELKTTLGNTTGALTKAKVNQKSPLKRLAVIEPVWTYPNAYNADNPLRPDYYNPTSWFVQGKEIHATRLLTFVGRKVPDLLKPAYSFGGLSLSQMAKPYVDNWLRTRQSVSDLIRNFSVNVLKTSMGDLLTGGGAQQMINRAKVFNQFRDNRGLMLLDKDKEEFVNVSAPLGSLDHLQAQSQEHMSAVSGIPLVKLLGITPSGLNASSDGEMRCFYDWIEACQEAEMTEPLSVIINLVQLSLFGEVDPDIGFKWERLWSLDEAELATARKTEADTDVEYINAGVILPQEARVRLAADEDSPYASLDLSIEVQPPAPEPGSEDLSDLDDAESDQDELGNDSKKKPENLAADAEHWITAHPNGKEHDGHPLLIEGEGGSYTVKGGAGGKLNGTKVSPKGMSKPRAETESGAASSTATNTPEPTPAEKASQHAHKLSETAKTAQEHYDASNAHLDAYKLADKSTDAAAVHLQKLRDHAKQWADLKAAEKKQEARAKKAALSGSEAGKQKAQIESRFTQHSPEDVHSHFMEKHGLGFANGSNAEKEYKKLSTEYKKKYYSLSQEERQELQNKRKEFADKARSSQLGGIRGHTQYDISDGSTGSKAMRKMLGHIDEALSGLAAKGYNIKDALNQAKVQIASGTTGKANGHSWQARNGYGNFAVSTTKRLNQQDDQVEQAKRRAARGEVPWSRSTAHEDDATRSTIVHELAHALGLQRHISSPDRLERILMGMHGNDRTAMRNWIKQNISEYATANKHETDAELAAMVTSPHYQQGTLPKELEDHVHWLFNKKEGI